jgi:hypothetical protein
MAIVDWMGLPLAEQRLAARRLFDNHQLGRNSNGSLEGITTRTSRAHDHEIVRRGQTFGQQDASPVAQGRPARLHNQPLAETGFELAGDCSALAALARRPAKPSAHVSYSCKLSVKQ